MKKRGVFAKKSNWNILKLLKIRASEYGNKEFVRFDSGNVLSFKSLDELSDKMAYKLLNIGLKEDENVFCLLKNSPEFLIALFAVMKTGAVFVPINTELRGQFLEHQYLNCEPKIAIIDNSLLDVFDSIKSQETRLKGTIITDTFDEASIPIALHSEVTLTFDSCFENITNISDSRLLESASIHKICAIMYTSGTTGPSKGVLLPHGHFFSYAIISAEAAHFSNKDTQYICMPLFHINALSIQCFAALYAGMSVYCVERFSPNRWLSDLQKSKATTTHLLGVMPEFVFGTEKSKEDKNHLLRLVSAVPIGEWGKEFEKRFNIKFLQGFGMTESGMSFWASLSEETCIPGRAGYPISELYDVRIADPENDEVLPPNTVGELLIRPKHPGIFSAGYYKMPDKTVEAWRNLWFHTGDACYFDEKGRMHYFDRIKDCIRRRGENISAFELEQVINAYPEIEESAAIGVKTENSGGEDEVLICIVTKKETLINTDHFLSFCQEKLPRFAVPKYMRIIDSIRKTGSGKLSKVDVRKEGLTEDVITLIPDRK